METRSDLFRGGGPEAPIAEAYPGHREPATAPPYPAPGGAPGAPAEDRAPTAEAGAGERKPSWKRLIGPLVAAAILLVKFGAKLKGALLLVTKVKFLTTSGSALVSVAAYALIWTWKFALGLVILLFIHEMGHVLQLRREGIRASAPMFVPFLGAYVGMKELPKDAAAEARVGLAGPVLGTLGCLIPLGIFLATGDELFQVLAYIGFFLNLFNLAPVLPLDGGRAMAALTPWMWVVGWLLLIALMVVFPSPIILLVALLGGFETYRRWKQRHSPEAKRYNRVSGRTRAAVAAVYLGLAVLLAVGMDLTFLERSLESV
jgi:Zn-dependent protease